MNVWDYLSFTLLFPFLFRVERMTKNKAIEGFQPLVGTVAAAMRKTYRLSKEDYEDISSQVILKLCSLSSAQIKAHTQSNGKADAWLRTVVNNASRDALNRILRKQSFSLDEPTSDSAFSTFGESLPDSADIEQTTIQRVMIERFLSLLDKQQAEIVCLFHGIHCNPLTLRAIGKRFSMNYAQIQAVLDEATAIMQQATTPQYLAFQSTCQVCHTAEILLVPSNGRMSRTCHCMQCDRLTPYLGQPVALILSSQDYPLVDAMERFEITHTI